MSNIVIPIQTDNDTELTLQIVSPTITDATGTRQGEKEVALLLSQNVGLESDGEQVTLLNAKQIEELIEQIQNLKNQITA